MINMGPFWSLSTVQLISSPSFSYLVTDVADADYRQGGSVYACEHGGEEINSRAELTVQPYGRMTRNRREREGRYESGAFAWAGCEGREMEEWILIFKFSSLFFFWNPCEDGNAVAMNGWMELHFLCRLLPVWVEGGQYCIIVGAVSIGQVCLDNTP